MSENSTDLAPQKEIGRNEPCPCGSGKKYKRCHGVGAAPKVTPPKHMMDPSLAGGAGAPGGFGGMFGGGMPGADVGGMGADPFAGMDQGQMLQFAQALQRLPKGQLQKLQGIMQRAMAGKDVTREAADFERSLPVEFQEMLRNFKMPPEMAASMGAGVGSMNAPIEVAPEEPAAPMTANDARRIVEQAVAEGKISKEQAEALLQAPPSSAEEATAVEASGNAPAEEDKTGGIGKLWRGLTGKK